MTIDDIIDGILAREGDEYTNDPADHGGATKYGVTLAAWREAGHPDATAADIAALTEHEARAFYLHTHYWAPGFNQITDPWTQVFLVDTGVLEGIETAVMMVQHIVGVTADGRLGPITVAAIAARDPLALKKALLTERMHHLIDCALADFTHDQVNGSDLKWLHGWTNRVLSFL
jgi:lysozyme family protein